MRTLLAGALAAALALPALPASATIKASVSGEAREEINTAFFVDRYKALTDYVAAASGLEVRLTFGRDLSRELQRTRSGGYDLIIGPAHVVGSAVRYGYEPVARFPGEETAVFLATEASGVTSLEGAKGKRLAMPPTDSLATYLARGELNAKGLQAKRHFAEIREFRYHEAALLALEFGQADVAVADRRLAEDWLKRNKGRILLETKAAPGTSVAVLGSLDKPTKDKLRAAFLAPNPKVLAGAQLAGLDVTKMTPITVADFEYVSTLGYFTPRVLDGARIVTAEEAAELMKKGVPIYDTRNKEEYTDRHIKGAVSLPYGEKSRKEVGFDQTKDSFDLTKLAQDKNSPVIFACNGAECWKSYKASVAAIKAGYKQVYWFRGGFPEWRAKGLPTQ
ncbi:MAG: PhnD/SsuA/transferrin family substrate-binding protein [Burkholderiales bacterium]|nr:PhnD/SsuA/transferrin family substrate-binding protein [Burkholderiales bacterium]